MVLLIYGASGLAHEIYDLIMRSMPERWEKIYFIDDFIDEGPCYLSESIHFESIITRFGNNMGALEGIVAVGEPVHREMLYHKFKDVGISVATIIDGTAKISPAASIGEGSIICEMATVHAGVKIEKNVLIQPFCNIGHDIKIGAHSVISSFSAPGGQDVIGNRVFVGLHVAIKEKVCIGDDAIIGMGSVVFKDVESGATVIGNPARVTKGNDKHKVFVQK